MNKNDPQFIWVGLILPSLFAMSLLADGFMKLLRKEPAWVSFGLGTVFIIIIFVFYFVILK